MRPSRGAINFTRSAGHSPLGAARSALRNLFHSSPFDMLFAALNSIVAKALILRSLINSPERWSERPESELCRKCSHGCGVRPIDISAIVLNPSTDLYCLTVYVIISWDALLGSSAPHTSFLEFPPPITAHNPRDIGTNFLSVSEAGGAKIHWWRPRSVTGSLLRALVPAPHNSLGDLVREWGWNLWPRREWTGHRHLGDVMSHVAHWARRAVLRSGWLTS